MSNTNDSASAIQEIQWTDDVIRWQGGLNGEPSRPVVDRHELPPSTERDSHDDEEEGCMVDPFQDPDPLELHTFRFRLPRDSSRDAGSSSSPTVQAPTEIDVVIRGYKTDADEVWKSTGLTLWKASRYLCQYQLQNAHRLFRGKRVLELGAGLGLNGILAWKIMRSLPSLASDIDNSPPENVVCITDGDSDALVLLRENIRRNRPPPANDDVRVDCHQLLWGASASLSFLEQIAHNRKYHVILASDILYAPSVVEPLWETVEALLEEDGLFVMAFARRKVPVSIESVLEEARRHGFCYELAKEDEEEGIWVYSFEFVKPL